MDRLIGGVNCRVSIRDQQDHRHEAFMVVQEAASMLVSACPHDSHARHCLLTCTCMQRTYKDLPAVTQRGSHVPMVLQLMAS